MDHNFWYNREMGTVLSVDDASVTETTCKLNMLLSPCLCFVWLSMQPRFPLGILINIWYDWFADRKTYRAVSGN